MHLYSIRLLKTMCTITSRGLLTPGIGRDPVPGFSIWYFWIPDFDVIAITKETHMYTNVKPKWKFIYTE